MAYRRCSTADTNLMHGLRSDGLQRRVPPENPPGLRLLLRTADESRGAEFILSLCPGGVNGCHFVTVNPRAHVCRSRDGGIPFTPGRAPHHRQPPTAVTDRFDTRRRAVFSSTTAAISGVNWAAVVQRDDKGLLGSCQRVASGTSALRLVAANPRRSTRLRPPTLK